MTLRLFMYDNRKNWIRIYWGNNKVKLFLKSMLEYAFPPFSLSYFADEQVDSSVNWPAGGSSA